MVDSLEDLGLPEATSLRERIDRNDPQDREALVDALRRYGLPMERQKIRDSLAQGRIDEILIALPGAEEPWMPEMVDVPGGTFMMGGTRNKDEKPIRKVSLSAYRLGRDPVTNAQYAEFIRDGGYTTQEYWSDQGLAWRTRKNITFPAYWESGEYHSGPNYPNHPVVGVNWYEAEAYCRWLSKRKATNVHLPSEAQWEYGARGPDSREYPWVNEAGKSKWDGSRCNFDSEGTTEVGSYPKGISWCGARDMIGNVWELTADWHDPEGYNLSDTNNPTGLASGESKVQRGGSWSHSNSDYVRSAFRFSFRPVVRNFAIGFRVAEGGK